MGQVRRSHPIRLSRISSRPGQSERPGPTTGECLQRVSGASADTFDLMYGRSSATRLPSSVIVTRWPWVTRSITWPQWFRKSGTVTSLTSPLDQA